MPEGRGMALTGHDGEGFGGTDTGILVSAVQNIQVLLRYGSYLKTSPSVMIEQLKRAMRKGYKVFFRS